MTKKTVIRLTENELHELVMGVVKQTINEGLLTEMAMSIDEYHTKCNGTLFNLISHLIKVCLFEEISPSSVNTWKNEIYSYAKPMVIGKIKKISDKTKYTKRYVYDTYWGENFEEYDETAPQFFNEVICDYANEENPQKRLIANVSANDAAIINKPRIKHFFDELIAASKGSGDLNSLRVAVENFINFPKQ